MTVTAPLHYECLLKENPDMIALWQFLQDNASRAALEGLPLRVWISQEEESAHEFQRRAYWGYVLAPISEQVWVRNRRYDRDVWHEKFAEQFLPKTEIVLPDGKIFQRRQSIAKGHISAKKMAQYVQQVRAEAASELGVVFPVQEER